MKKIALIGNPNSGKTTLFNSLTGSTAHVGNWPGVTVDKRDALLKKSGKEIYIIDLPGIYSLSPYTPEEVISRNYILDEKPDCIINIVDATNLERNLYLTTQVLEMDVPVVVALNMMDIVKKDGTTIDITNLSNQLGVPVVEISALKETGLKSLISKAVSEADKTRKASTVLATDLKLNNIISEVREKLDEKKVSNSLFHAIKITEIDEIEEEKNKALVDLVKAKISSNSKDSDELDLAADIADCRYQYITKVCNKVLKKKESSIKETKSDKADKILTNKWLSIPIFLLILFGIFHLTFSENLFYLGGLFKEGWVSLEGTAFEGVFGEGGINSPGVILANLMGLATDSLSGLVAGWLETSPAWVSGFIVDGVLAGLFSILSFIPQILVLFLFFSILEDSGYMARIAFILDRIFRKFGLSGRAFMPMIMGFGCSIPAMINTRTLKDDNERVATIRVIPFFSCGAKLPILTAIAGGIVQFFGVGNADVITYSMYLLGIVVAIAAVLFMRNTTMRGEVPPFIMELPAYHMPQFKNLMIHLWDKAKHFIKKAFTIILASTIVIWFISHFSFNWQFLEDADMDKSILAGLGGLVTPLFTPLGFGSQLNAFSWVFVVAAVTGLIAKENVIATFGTLAACITAGFEANEALEGVDSAVQMIQVTGITIPALLAFIAFNMTTIPCFAAVASAKAELGDKKKYNWTLVFWVATSYIVATAIYLIGSWWWTSFIFAAILAGIIVLIHLNNKGKLNCFKKKGVKNVA